MSGRLPPWFKQHPADPQVMSDMEHLLGGLKLGTICESAHCPNIGGCFTAGTATFLILGEVCSRHCTFCAVPKGRPNLPDEEEPQRLLEAVERLGLSYVVITSVTRDDLPDGGAGHFARIIRLLHDNRPGVIIEVLIPDFLGSAEALETVAKARPEVINHNIETVPRLYPEVRPEADYRRSLELLLKVKEFDPEIVTKSGLMLGLGENGEEVRAVMRDLRAAGCDLLTIGQYLQPSVKHHPVVKFIPPEEFTEYREAAKNMEFKGVTSAPLVRSSFRATEIYAQARGHGYQIKTAPVNTGEKGATE